MLTDNDVAFIKANRAEVTQHRTEPITLHGEVVSGTDPFTGDPTYTPTETIAYGVWSDQTGTDEKRYVNGVEVLEGDALISFDLSEVTTANLRNVTKVTHDGVDYSLVATDAIGLGGDNRVECIARRIT